MSGLEASASELLRFPGAATTTPRGKHSSLSTVQGIRLPEGAGFMASCLGLPRLSVHGSQPALSVLALTACGEVIPYHSVGDPEAAASGQLWQPGADQRRRTTLAAGAAASRPLGRPHRPRHAGAHSPASPATHLPLQLRS